VTRLSGFFFALLTTIVSAIAQDDPSAVVAGEQPFTMKVVATGGLAAVFKDEIGLFDAIEPDLMSLGLLEIWRRNNK